MRKNIFFIVICFLTICENFVSSNADNGIGNIIKLSDVSKELLEVSLAANADESKDAKDDCQTNKDCSYRGTCNDNQGQKTCSCYKGISGKSCKTIDECVENPSMCGEGKDVECAYDHENKKAFCECTNETQRFDVPQKKCVNQKPCLEQQQCLNGGVCTARGDTKYCDCKLGTSGDFCERIEECIKKPNLCGDGNDVKCEFNARQNRAYCQCQNQNLRFDLPQKKCVERESCRFNDCIYGRCTDKCQDYEPCYNYTHIEDKDSCHCIEGTSGEKCEIVDDCYNKIVDCGSGDNVDCSYSYSKGLKGFAFCHCANNTQSFDSVAKLCKDCDCGPMSYTCYFDKGQKICSCKPQSYNFGDRCEDCQCGEGSTGCSFKEESKTCFCNPGFAEVNGRCERCDCGENSTDCKFSNGRKVCTCEPGFTEGNYGICTPMCNDTLRCANGGLCLQSVCVCLAGTGGPFCETVTDCERKMCGIHQNVSCIYDTEKQRTFCQCQNTDSIFDTFNKTCKMCECSRGYEKSTESCEFVSGKKICHCKKGYAHSPVIDKCYPCGCGPNSTSCKIDRKGKIFCGCEDGFVDISGKCTKCDCGNHGVCRYIQEKSKFIKVCACDTGYEDYKGTCVKCDCGPNGKCNYFLSGKTRSCSCDTGYAEDYGKCKICDCGPNSKCYFESRWQYCHCATGYKFVEGYCREEVKAPNYTPWKIGYGVISAGFVAIIIGLVIIIFIIRRKINPRNSPAAELSEPYSRHI